MSSAFANRLARADLPEQFEPWFFGIPALDNVVGGVRPGFTNLICARPHVGKRLHEDTPVLTPSGWAPIKNIAIGSRVIGRDGMAYNVTGVFREEDRPLYRITFSDGVTIDADDEHIWTVRNTAKRAQGWHDLTTAEIVETGVLDAQGKRRFHVPLVEAVDGFEPQHLNDDPYAVGVVLGDGTSKQNLNGTVNWRVCTDVEILDAIGATRCKPHETSPYTAYGTVHVVDLKAGRSWEKAVPEQYLYGSREQRHALLQGLLDTDGYPMGNGGVEFCSTSESLVDAVVFLTQSLGGICCSRRVAASTYTHNGEKRTGRRAERVNLKLPASIAPFRLQRKLERWVPPTKYPPTRSIVSIERIENGPGVCISVDSPDHLYVVKDFVVTHNTLLVLAGIRNNPELPTLFISADDDPELAVRKMMFYDGIFPSVEAAHQAGRDQLAEYVGETYPMLDIVDGVTWGPASHNNQISVANAVENFTESHGDPPGLIVYDYLGIDGNSYDIAMSVAAWMKHLAKIMPMPILTIAQSSRAKSRSEKMPDGSFVRRGFQMEDLSFGGEQQAGLMMGLSKAKRLVNGLTQSVIEVDIVKNKAVFDGSGLTDPTDPIILCHHSGRLVGREEAQYQWMAQQAALDEVHRQETRGWG